MGKNGLGGRVLVGGLPRAPSFPCTSASTTRPARDRGSSLNCGIVPTVLVSTAADLSGVSECSVVCVPPFKAAPGQAPLPMGFSRREYWSGTPCPPPGDQAGISCASCTDRQILYPLSHLGSLALRARHHILHALGGEAKLAHSLLSFQPIR